MQLIKISDLFATKQRHWRPVIINGTITKLSVQSIKINPLVFDYLLNVRV